MPFTTNDKGGNNSVSLSDDIRRALPGTLTLRGDDNFVSLGDNISGHQVQIECGSSCSVVIGNGCRLGLIIIYALKKGVIEIGNECTFNGRVRLLSHEPASLLVGNGCLFAGDVDVMTSDMHSIVDLKSGNRLNLAADIVIGDRVWIGQRAMLLKGSNIGEGSIIAAGAVVTGEIPPNCVAAGMPAKVIRTGVTWRPDLI